MTGIRHSPNLTHMRRLLVILILLLSFSANGIAGSVASCMSGSQPMSHDMAAMMDGMGAMGTHHDQDLAQLHTLQMQASMPDLNACDMGHACASCMAHCATVLPSVSTLSTLMTSPVLNPVVMFISAPLLSSRLLRPPQPA